MYSVELSLENLDDLFDDLGFEPIILNDVPARTKQERAELSELILTTYDKTDTLSSTPSCRCGTLSMGVSLGELCVKCGHRVELPATRRIDANVWFRTPEGIKSMISPMFWLIFNNSISRPQLSVLDWLCNPYYEVVKPNRAVLAILAKFEKNNLKRGLNNFVDKFDEYLPILLSLITSRSSRDDMRRFVMEYRHCIFAKHVPMPNKIAFILENTSTVSYADPVMREAIDAARTISSIDEETRGSIRRMESKVTSIISSLAGYYMKLYGAPFSKKTGWLRNTLYGTRMGMAFRSVIVSDSGIHDYKTMKLPYSQLVTVAKMHIINYLYKRWYSPREAWDFVDRYTMSPDSTGIMESILKQIIDSGLWAAWIRYPTLKRAGCQALRICGYLKTAATLSVMDTKGPNADYDGDQLSGALILTKEQLDAMLMFKPHYGIFSHREPGTFNRNIVLPEVDIGIFANWTEDEDYDVAEIIGGS